MAGVVAPPGLWGNVGTIVCDLDGVVYVEGHEVPGAGAALDSLRRSGYRLLFATNNASKTAADVVESIRAFTGFSFPEESVVTSSRVTAMALQGKARRVYVIGQSALAGAMASAGFDVVESRREADAVVVGMDFGLTYDKLAEAALAIRAGALFYATNADNTYPTADGLKPGGGAIVAALEAATGVTAVVCGKPHRPTADALRSLASDGGVVVVGDRIETDIALGQSQGWATALVLTGVTSAEEAAASEVRPDVVLDSLADLPAVLAATQTR